MSNTQTPPRDTLINDPERKANLRNARFPEDLLSKPFETLKSHTKWAQAAHNTDKFLDKHNLACIFGAGQTGKTQIATTLGKSRVLLRGRTAFYGPLSLFITDFEARDRLWEVVEDRYYSPADLFLDNCHLIYQTGIHQSWIDALVDRRLNEGLTTTLIFQAHAASLPTYMSTGVANHLNGTLAVSHCDWPPFAKPSPP